MAANYWASTQYRFWTLTKAGLAGRRWKLEQENADLVRAFPLPEPRELNIYFHSRR
jgi:cyclin C